MHIFIYTHTYICDIYINTYWRCQESKTKTWYLYIPFKKTSSVPICDMTPLHSWQDSFVCTTWLFSVCGITPLHSWHDSFVCATWLFSMCDMTLSCLLHDPLQSSMGWLRSVGWCLKTILRWCLKMVSQDGVLRWWVKMVS